MKKLIYLFATIAVAGWLCGCATFQTNTYKAIGTAAVAVDASMQAWGDYVRQGKATPAQEATVRAAYEKYQQAMRTAHVLVTAHQTYPTQKPLLEQALAALQDAVLALQAITLNPAKT
jgi:hypothetical protein